MAKPKTRTPEGNRYGIRNRVKRRTAIALAALAGAVSPTTIATGAKSSPAPPSNPNVWILPINGSAAKPAARAELKDSRQKIPLPKLVGGIRMSKIILAENTSLRLKQQNPRTPVYEVRRLATEPQVDDAEAAVRAVAERGLRPVISVSPVELTDNRAKTGRVTTTNESRQMTTILRRELAKDGFGGVEVKPLPGVRVEAIYDSTYNGDLSLTLDGSGIKPLQAWRAFQAGKKNVDTLTNMPGLGSGMAAAIGPNGDTQVVVWGVPKGPNDPTVVIPPIIEPTPAPEDQPPPQGTQVI